MNQIWIYLGACIVLWILVLIFRKRLQIDGLKWKGIPIIYMASLNLGNNLGFIDRFVAKHAKFVRAIGVFCVWLGFICMIASVGLLAYQIVLIEQQPELAVNGTIKMVLPVETKFSIYVPIWYWLASIVVIMLVHEGGHALLARAYGLPIKRTGIMVAGIIIPLMPGAFVDPDEEEMKKRPAKEMLPILAAGSAFNLLFATAIAIVSTLVMPHLSAAFNPLRTLVYWLLILNFGIGMTNLLPIGPLDGAKMVDQAVKPKLLASIIKLSCLGLFIFTLIQGF